MNTASATAERIQSPQNQILCCPNIAELRRSKVSGSQAKIELCVCVRRGQVPIHVLV